MAGHLACVVVRRPGVRPRSRGTNMTNLQLSHYRPCSGGRNYNYIIRHTDTTYTRTSDIFRHVRVTPHLDTHSLAAPCPHMYSTRIHIHTHIHTHTHTHAHTRLYFHIETHILRSDIISNDTYQTRGKKVVTCRKDEVARERERRKVIAIVSSCGHGSPWPRDCWSRMQ